MMNDTSQSLGSVRPDVLFAENLLYSTQCQVIPINTLAVVHPQSTPCTSFSNPAALYQTPQTPAEEDDDSIFRYTPQPIKRRKRSTKAQLKILEEAYRANPMPNTSTRNSLGDQVGKTSREVQVWFQNRRAKDKQIKRSQMDQRPLLVNETSMLRRGSAPTVSNLDQGHSNDLSEFRRGSLPAKFLPPPLPLRHHYSPPIRHSTHLLPPHISVQPMAGPLPAPDFSFGTGTGSTSRPERDTQRDGEAFASSFDFTRPGYGSFVSVADSTPIHAYSRFGCIANDGSNPNLRYSGEFLQETPWDQGQFFQGFVAGNAATMPFVSHSGRGYLG